MDVPGGKLPSSATGALQEYLRSTIAPQVPAHLLASVPSQAVPSSVAAADFGSSCACGDSKITTSSSSLIAQDPGF